VGFTLLDLLELEPLGDDIFRNGVVFDQERALYGGQVAAQALAAAGMTVDPDRRPHSLHGYFLRPGRTDKPMILRVSRDRDGRSFSARRVVAVQDGEVILNLACSFAVAEDGIDNQLAASPLASGGVGAPRQPSMVLPSIEIRAPEQPTDDLPWQTRMWIRCVLPLPADPLLNACVLTYVSDLGSGLASLASAGEIRSTTTLDHALWFHRPAVLTDWVLLDLQPGSTAGGRGWYTGTVHDEEGVHVASLVQETLFRRPRTT
jgi:acyl-CoA thioesterase-2